MKNFSRLTSMNTPLCASIGDREIPTKKKYLR